MLLITQSDFTLFVDSLIYIISVAKIEKEVKKLKKIVNILFVVLLVLIIHIYIPRLNAFWNEIKIDDGIFEYNTSVGNWRESRVIAYYELSTNTYSNIEAETNSSIGFGIDGNLYAWGANSSERLGLNTSDPYILTPTLIPILNFETVISYSISSNGGVAVTEDGKLYSWGMGFHADGIVTTHSIPTLMNDPNVTGIHYVEAKHELLTTVAIDKEGRVYIWGVYDNHLALNGIVSGMIPTPQIIDELSHLKIISIKRLKNTIIAIDEHGNAYSWGANLSGECGLNNVDSPITVPTKINIGDNEKISKMVNGENHVLALTTDGNLYGWGINRGGQLGLGHQDSYVSAPTKNSIISELDIKSIHANYDQSAIITDSNHLYAWGLNTGNKLGFNDLNLGSILDSPIKNESYSNVVEVSFGQGHGFIRLKNGNLYGFGSNASGELGNDEKTDFSSMQEHVVVASYSLIKADMFISNLLYKLFTPQDIPNSIFGGWYLDVDLNIPFANNTKMPNYNISVYGFWESNKIIN